MSIEDRIVNALINASRTLPSDIEDRIVDAKKEEEGNGRLVLDAILENIEIAKSTNIPLCQDTGMLWVWAEIGRDAKVSLKELESLIIRSAEKAFKEGDFRHSVVLDPIERQNNSGNNMPPLINYSLSEGEDITLHFLLKGFGSENCSSVRMLNPTCGREGVINAVLDIMSKAGAKPCPPVFLGVGIGGTMDRATLLSKEAFFKRGEDRALETEIKERINKMGSGAGGLGGKNTCLDVSILSSPTHIAGLPVAVTVNCWAERRASITLKGGYDGENS